MASLRIQSKAGPGLQQVDLTKLSIAHLGQLKQQLDQDLSMYQESLQNLKHAQTRFQESSECLNRINSQSMGKDILVPLTGSMYVPGKVSNTETVIIDIGTGYYVEKDVEAAKSHFNRKVKYITEQMEKIQVLGVEKSKVRDAVMEVMELKVAQMAQQQQASK